MHIPDGFLDTKTAAATTALAAAGLGVALWHARKNLPPRKVPLLGLSAAFVFAAQMINFPVAGGTSGHLIGGVLAAVLLGPSAAVVVIASVLIVQALLYGDGGITALGANILNMALIGGVLGYWIYSVAAKILPGITGRLAGAAVACWCTTVLAAICCAGEIAASGHVPWKHIFPAMAGWHMLIGIGEAVITVLVLAAVLRVRPELITPRENEPASTSRYWATAAYGVLIALAIALFASPWASKSPDGLDRVAGDLQFETAAKRQFAAPMEEYKTPGIASETAATSLAGGIGTTVVFGGSLAVAWVLARRRTK